MGGRRRLALEITLLGVAFACIWAFLYVAPGPHSCPSISCPGFDSGTVHFLGSDRFTLVELLLIGTALVAGAFGLAWGVLRWKIGLGAAFTAFAVAVVLAAWIPTRVVGAAPSVVCSTPGADGPVSSRCETGPAPTDPRVGERLLLGLSGLVVLGIAVGVDRSRPPSTV
ncbi:MAG: hypothetical protein ACJ76P_13955 [Actinomycetota bacterium]